MKASLIPEIWLNVAAKFKCEALKLTTRDIPNYDELMQYRLKVLKKEGIKLPDIEAVISKMRPLPGAKTFLNELKSVSQVVILSDTFYEFSHPLMKQLGFPTLFCNFLKINKSGSITGYQLRQKDGKRKAVLAFQKVGFKVHAAGDSYNDLTMIQTADKGAFFNPPASIKKEYPKVPVARSYSRLLKLLS